MAEPSYADRGDIDRPRSCDPRMENLRLPYLDTPTVNYVLQNVPPTFPQLAIRQSDFFVELENTGTRYFHDIDRKPMPRRPVPYAILVGLALFNSEKPITTCDIYAFIRHYFPGCISYAKYWKNSVRHTLTKSQFVLKHTPPDSTNLYCLYSMDEDKLDVFKKALDHFLRNGSDPSKYGDWDAIISGKKGMPQVEQMQYKQAPVLRRKASKRRSSSVAVNYQEPPRKQQNLNSNLNNNEESAFGNGNFENLQHSQITPAASFYPSQFTQPPPFFCPPPPILGQNYPPPPPPNQGYPPSTAPWSIPYGNLPLYRPFYHF